MRPPVFEDGVQWMLQTIRNALDAKHNYGSLVLNSASIHEVEAQLYKWVTLDTWHLNDLLRETALRANTEFGDRMSVLEFHTDFSDQPNYLNRDEGCSTKRGPPHLEITAKFAPSCHRTGDKVCIVYQAASVYQGHAYVELCDSNQGRSKKDSRWCYRILKFLGFTRN